MGRLTTRTHTDVDAVFGGVGQQGEITGSFDGRCQQSLVFGGRAGLARRLNFALFRNITSQPVHIFVVRYDPFHGESANATARAVASATPASPPWAATTRRTPAGASGSAARSSLGAAAIGATGSRRSIAGTGRAARSGRWRGSRGLRPARSGSRRGWRGRWYGCGRSH